MNPLSVTDFLNKKTDLSKAVKHYILTMTNTEELVNIITKYGSNVHNCVQILIKRLL